MHRGMYRECTSHMRLFRLLLSCTVPRTIINLHVGPPSPAPRATRNDIDIDIETKNW